MGVGLADMIHQDLLREIDLGDTYLNVATSGETRRAKLLLTVPDDAGTLAPVPSVTGTPDPKQLRIARIRNTMKPGELLVSGAIVPELRDRGDVTVGDLRELSFTDGDLEDDRY